MVKQAGSAHSLRPDPIVGIGRETTIPAICKCCQHPRAVELDQDLLENVPVATVLRKYAFPASKAPSQSGVYRHMALHLSKTILREARLSSNTSEVTVAAGVREALEACETVRRSAMLSNNAALVLRAVSTHERLARMLLREMGAESGDTVRLLEEGEQLASAVNSVARHHPAFAADLQRHFLEAGQTDLARATQNLITKEDAA